MQTGSAQAADPTAREHPADAPEAPPTLLGALRAVLTDLRQAVDSRAHLFSLELKQAGLALTQMVILAVLAALMLCSAWIALMGGLFMAGMAAGMDWYWALLVVIAVNLGAAGAIWWRARRLTEVLAFPATRQMMRSTLGSQASASPGPSQAGAGMQPPLRTQEAGHA